LIQRRYEERPYCYGKIEIVFPLGGDGLRHTPESCMPCVCKTQCLRDAMQTADGISVREEVVDRAYHGGTMRFFERWLRKKTLYHWKRSLR